jgi:hypothetical protein
MYNAYTVTEKVITSISVKLYYERNAGINTEILCMYFTEGREPDPLISTCILSTISLLSCTLYAILNKQMPINQASIGFYLARYYSVYVITTYFHKMHFNIIVLFRPFVAIGIFPNKQLYAYVSHVRCVPTLI